MEDQPDLELFKQPMDIVQFGREAYTLVQLSRFLGVDLKRVVHLRRSNNIDSNFVDALMKENEAW